VVSPFRALLVGGLLALACSGLERGHAVALDGGPDAPLDADASADTHPDAALDAVPDGLEAEPADGDTAEVAASPCDDDDPCTIDAIAAADACTHWPAPDGSACGGGRQCLGGACVEPCWSGPCPGGLELFDGCRCRVPPSGLAADRCLADQGLVPCETILPGSPWFGQDGHVDGRSLHVAFTNPWTTADQPPPDHVTDLRTGLRWSLLQGEKTLAQAESTCVPVNGTPQRLPTLEEALTLIDLGAGRCPWLDPRLSAHCPVGPFRLWSATPLPWDATRRFVATGKGPSSAPVDTAQTICLQEPPAAAPSGERLVDAGTDTIFDRATGLAWQREPACAACTWGEALSACSAQPGGWHLATAREAFSLLCPDRLPPLVDEPFAGPLADDPSADGTLWTGSPAILVDDPTPRALAQDLRTGTSTPLDVAARHVARCVRVAPVGTERLEPEARASALTAGDQLTTGGRPALAALSDGGFAAVWLDRPAAQASSRVMVRRFDARGQARDGAEVALSGDDDGEAAEPTLAVAADGALLVAWEQRVAGRAVALVLRAVGSDGQPSGEARRLAGPEGASRRHPTLAALPSGGFVLGFDEGCDEDAPVPGCQVPADPGWEVLALRVDISGEPLAEPVRLSEQSTGDQVEPALAALPDGRVFAGWIDRSTGQARLRTRVVDPASGDGAPETDAGNGKPGSQRPTAFATADAAVLTWEQREGSAPWRAYLAQFTHGGTPLLPKLPVAYSPLYQVPTPATHHRSPQGAAAPDGGLVVVYEISAGDDYLYSPNDYDAWAVAIQPFTEWAYPSAPPRRENAYTRGAQDSPSISVLPDGQRVVLWTTDGGSGVDRDVWFRRGEAACDDGRDNDQDGATDDADPDCAGRTGD